jgi:hypothetical protein
MGRIMSRWRLRLEKSSVHSVEFKQNCHRLEQPNYGSSANLLSTFSTFFVTHFKPKFKSTSKVSFTSTLCFSTSILE